MLYFSPGSHLFRLVTVLSLVGEYPTTSLNLLGDRQELGRLVQKLTQPQLIRNSATGEKLCVKVINLSGKSPCTTIRLSSFALPLLDWIGTREYYESRFTRSGMSSSKTHHERSYRVAETAVMLLRAGIECRPWMLPALQMQRRALIIDRPMALLARDVKQIEPESVNKTKYARYMSVLIKSTMTVRQTMAVAQMIPQYRQTEGQGRRRLLTPDEVLRLPNTDLLCVIRGCNMLRLKKLDYTGHRMSRDLQHCSILDYTPVIHVPTKPEHPQQPSMPSSDAALPEQSGSDGEKKAKKKREKLYSSSKPPQNF